MPVELDTIARGEVERALNRAARRMKFRLYLQLTRLNFLLFKIKLSRVRVRAHRFLLRLTEEARQ